MLLTNRDDHVFSELNKPYNLLNFSMSFGLTFILMDDRMCTQKVVRQQFVECLYALLRTETNTVASFDLTNF